MSELATVRGLGGKLVIMELSLRNCIKNNVYANEFLMCKDLPISIDIPFPASITSHGKNIFTSSLSKATAILKRFPQIKVIFGKIKSMMYQNTCTTT